MNYKFGEIVLIAFPFTSGVGSKKRPALVLYDADDPDILVARITSQPVFEKDDLVLTDSGRLHEGFLAILTKLSLESIIWLTRKSFRRMNRGLSVRVKILTGKIKFGGRR